MNKKDVFKFVGLVAGLLAIIVLANIDETYKLYSHMGKVYVVLITLIIVSYFLLGIRIVKPNEMAMRNTLGHIHVKKLKVETPVEVSDETPKTESSGISLESGPKFVFWPFTRLEIFTREQMKFSFLAKSIVTCKGKMKGYENEIEPATINLFCTFYAQFDPTRLYDAIRYAPGRNAKKLAPFLVPYVTDTVRALGGRIPWRLINQERRYSALWIKARLSGGKYYRIQNEPECEDGNICYKFPSSEDEIKGKTAGKKVAQVHDEFMEKIDPKNLANESPFVISGLYNVSFNIEDLEFANEDLKNAIDAPEQARLNAKASIAKAKASKEVKTLEGEGDAAAREAYLKTIKEAPELEALDAIKEIGKGQNNFIYSLPESINNILGSLVRKSSHSKDSKESKGA